MRMDDMQRKALDSCSSCLIKSLDINIIYKLRAEQVLTPEDLDNIKAEITSKAKVLHLIETLKNRDGGWNALIGCLRESKQCWIADKLIGNADNSEDGSDEWLAKLKDDTIKKTEIIRKVWCNYIPSIDLNEVYQRLKVVKARAVRSKKKSEQDEITSPENYLEKEKKNYQFIFIEGDPGVGKTTYVNKLANDWAWGRLPIKEYFKYVFLVNCGQIRKKDAQNLVKQIATAVGLTEDDDRLVKAIADKETLLIFDGYDENPVPTVNKLILGKMFHRIQKIRCCTRSKKIKFHGKVIVTARGTHAPIKTEHHSAHHVAICDLWMQIVGLEEDSLKNFLQNLEVNEENIDFFLQSTAITSILKIPLYATMVAAICRGFEIEIKRELNSLETQQKLNALFVKFEVLRCRALPKRFPEEENAEIFSAVYEYAASKIFKWCVTEKRQQNEGGENLEIVNNDTELNRIISSSLGRKFENYQPDYNKLEKSGAITCFKSMSMFNDVCSEDYDFLHFAFTEYYAACWFNMNYSKADVAEVLPILLKLKIPALFRYFFLSSSEALYQERISSYFGKVIYPVGFEAQKICQCMDNSSIHLMEWGTEWKIDDTNMHKFVGQFKEIKFHDCCFRRMERTDPIDSPKTHSIEVKHAKADISNLIKSFETIRSLKKLIIISKTDIHWKHIPVMEYNRILKESRSKMNKLYPALRHLSSKLEHFKLSLTTLLISILSADESLLDQHIIEIEIGETNAVYLQQNGSLQINEVEFLKVVDETENERLRHKLRYFNVNAELTQGIKSIQHTH